MTKTIPEHRPTRLPVFLASMLAKLYSIGINHQNQKYDKGTGVTTLDRPVISVGNLSTGGTGKTPLVQHVIRTLIDAGYHPAIAMRGYKAQSGQLSDEQCEHMNALPGVPIVAQPNRVAGLRALFDSDEGTTIDCVVLDDGFQHRKIARNLDIVVIDASRPPFLDALLPMGFLREAGESLCRAQMVVVSHAEMVEQEQLGKLRRWIEQIAPEVQVAVIEHRWLDVFVYEPGQENPVQCAVEELDGRPVAALTAIGHPDAFIAMAQDAGTEIVHRCDRPDHDAYSDEVLREFVQQAEMSGASAILTTSKDWTKLQSSIGEGVWGNRLPILVPRLGIHFRSGQCLFEAQCIKSLPEPAC
ncbi:MAG: tetraacyldisaccharide 4'-kinase [Phycisphaerales bacterium]|nr:tetraacyldisaccharide 4'-kinase [Phycisphaerales bacterium]